MPVLILLAHPTLQTSRVNARLLRAVRDLEGVTLHDLYEAYPDFGIDVPREQERLAAHEVVVFQHPFFWYSVPALLKEWFDLTLEHGWAYGRGASALRGKVALSALTAGGGPEAYREGGFNRFTLRQFLAPIDQTCALCGVDWLGPFAVHDTHRLSPAEIDRAAEEYRDVITALRDGRLDRAAAKAMPRITAEAVLG